MGLEQGSRIWDRESPGRSLLRSVKDGGNSDSASVSVPLKATAVDTTQTSWAAPFRIHTQERGWLCGTRRLWCAGAHSAVRPSPAWVSKMKRWRLSRIPRCPAESRSASETPPRQSARRQGCQQDGEDGIVMAIHETHGPAQGCRTPEEDGVAWPGTQKRASTSSSSHTDATTGQPFR